MDAINVLNFNGPGVDVVFIGDSVSTDYSTKSTTRGRRPHRTHMLVSKFLQIPVIGPMLNIH